MRNLELQRRQLDRSLAQWKDIEFNPPTKGWLHAIRSALGMPLSAAAKRLGKTPEGVLMQEKREANGSITLKSLREAAQALDCTLVYALVPKTDLDSILNQEAKRTADKMLNRTATTMSLEDQSTSNMEDEETLRALIRKLIANPKLIWKEQE
jgi:predicted DNA-binding mobile mystery protein A